MARLYLGNVANLYLRAEGDTGEFLKVGCAINSSFSSEREEIEARCKDTGGVNGWIEKQPGLGSFTIDTDGLIVEDNVVNPRVLWDWFNGKTKLDFQITTEVPGDTEVSGEAYIASFELAYPEGEFSTYTFTLMGTGEPTVAEIV